MRFFVLRRRWPSAGTSFCNRDETTSLSKTDTPTYHLILIWNPNTRLSSLHDVSIFPRSNTRVNRGGFITVTKTRACRLSAVEKNEKLDFLENACNDTDETWSGISTHNATTYHICTSHITRLLSVQLTKFDLLNRFCTMEIGRDVRFGRLARWWLRN